MKKKQTRESKYHHLGGPNDNPMAYAIAVLVRDLMANGLSLEAAAEKVEVIALREARESLREWRAGTFPGMEALNPEQLVAVQRSTPDGPEVFDLRRVSASRATKIYAYWFGRNGRAGKVGELH